MIWKEILTIFLKSHDFSTGNPKNFKLVLVRNKNIKKRSRFVAQEILKNEKLQKSHFFKLSIFWMEIITTFLKFHDLLGRKIKTTSQIVALIKN